MASPYQLRRREGRLQLDDIDGYYAALHALQFTLAAPAATIDLTAAAATAVATMSNNAQPALNQAMADINAEGWVLGADAGTIIIDVANTSQPPADAGLEVYGRLTSIAQLDFMKSDGAGGDAAVTLPAGTYVAYIPYLHSVEKLPWDFAIRAAKHRVAQDAAGSAEPLVEHKVITTLNTIPPLTAAPRAGTRQLLKVDGRDFYSDEPTPLFAVAGTAITWNAVAAGMDIHPGQRVSVKFVV